MATNTRWPRLSSLSPLFAVSLSVVAWGVLFTAIPPSQVNFPLGDDWGFALGAWSFARGDGIHYFRWASMPQLGQWLWSLPFLWVLGESHVALRVSTIVVGWLGLLALYYLLRAEKFNRTQASLAAATLACNPLFFVSQGTFMTDVPALSLALLSLMLYRRALQDESLLFLAAALAPTLLAVLTRQHTLAAPLVAGVLLVRTPRLRTKPLWLAATITPVLIGLGIHWWFTSRPDIRHISPVIPGTAHVLFVAYVALHLLGLSVLPLLVFLPPPKSWRRFGAALAVMLLGAAVCWCNGMNLQFGGLFPYLSGMIELYGAYSPGLVAGERDLLLCMPIRLLLTLLGCVGGAALLARLPEAMRALVRCDLLALFTALQFLLLLVVPSLFDRYFEVLLPGALCLSGQIRTPGRGRWFLGLSTLGITLLLSVGLMHDWLSWNVARWQLGEQAVLRGVDPRAVDGGFEWEGWYSRVPQPPRHADPQPIGWFREITRTCFAEITGRWILSYSPLPDTEVVESQEYVTWLPPSRKRFYLLTSDPETLRSAVNPPNDSSGKRDQN